jgi:UPF0716 family protein affecting phage T7 exclusion
MILLPGVGCLIRDNQLTVGTVVKVVILGLPCVKSQRDQEKGRNKMQNSNLYLASGERPVSIFLDGLLLSIAVVLKQVLCDPSLNTSVV